jgi:PAS domain S-box-containing protein
MSTGPDPITVLNVDDYEPGRYSRSRILRNAGFNVLEATTGREALDLVRAARPQLVLLDVNLPDMSGFEVCRQIKGDPALAQILVLHMSATSVSTNSKVKGLAAGADSYFAEPVDPDELIANIHALLRLKRAEEQLRQANIILQAIVTSSPVGIIATDTAGVVQQWNAAAERMFGWTAQEVVGGPLPIFPGEDGVPFHGWVDRAAAGETASGFEATPVRRDGSPIDVSLSLAPLCDGGGRIAGVLALLEDITARKRAARDVARLYEEAQEANRTKDAFLATLSHELRTPLNAMLGWVRMLRSGNLPEDRQAHALEVIERNTFTQVRLTEDILDVSRIVSGKLRLRSEPVDLARVVEAAAENMRPAADAAGVALHVSADGRRDARRLTMLGDPQRLQQVVANLLSNAVKFTAAGGRIEVELRGAPDRAHIVVRDTGIGIDPALLPLVFERFRQGDSSPSRAHGGLGLGLAIARHLVEAHGGSIAAESGGPGRGSTFTVALPIAAVAIPGGTPFTEEAGSAVSLHPLRVLLVEDDADSRGLLETTLAARGALVQSAATAASALALLECEPFDVLVADIGLPHADGYSLLREVRSVPSLADLPAVAVTGFASEEDRQRSEAAGYAAHVPKPVDLDMLARIIAGVARRGPGPGA